MYRIAVKFCDKENDKILTLGGAGWETEAEWEDAWDNILESEYTERSYCLADKIDENGSIVDDRSLSTDTVETLLSTPIYQLIETARAKSKEG